MIPGQLLIQQYSELLHLVCEILKDVDVLEDGTWALNLLQDNLTGNTLILFLKIRDCWPTNSKIKQLKCWKCKMVKISEYTISAFYNKERIKP